MDRWVLIAFLTTVFVGVFWCAAGIYSVLR